MRRGVASLLAATLVTSLLVVVPVPAQAKPTLPAGASTNQPRQVQGSAAGRRHQATPADTAAAKSIPPPGAPALPPGAKGVVGPEKQFPDPAKPTGPQCRGCGPGTPVPAPADGRSADPPVKLSTGKVTGFVAGASKELTDQRTATSTTFANPDGTKTLRMYSGPTYTRDSAGKMTPIDTRLVRGTDGRYAPMAAEKVSFAGSSADSRVAAMGFGDGVEAGFALSASASVPATVSGSDVRFADVRPGADLVLSPTSTGYKENIVLRSPDAPTTWRFPLRLKGLTPQLVPAAGRVDLVDAAGTVRAVIPPGFMVDSAPADPRTGTGARSNAVAYGLSRDGDTWVLDVTLDAAWLKSPDRKYPVTVDPSMRNPAFDDTFVSTNWYANRDNSADPRLRVGTPNGGGEVAASYIHFWTSLVDLRRRYILGASLNLYSLWALTCTPSKLNVYRVAQSWTQNTVTSWPGPLYDAENPVATASFAKGGYCSGSEGWASIPIDPDRVTQWMHLYEPWYGFTLRASGTDSNAEKIFESYESKYPGSGGPFFDVIYSDEGAFMMLPSQQISPPVTPSTSGKLEVWAQNLGKSDWTTTNGFRLAAILRNGSGAEIKRTLYPVSRTIGDLDLAQWNIDVGPLAAGNYSIRLTMVDGAGHLFDDYYGIPRQTASFSVLPESAPVVTALYPPNNAEVDTLRPSVWAEYYDADRAPGDPRWWFQACNGTPDAPVGCQNTGWVDNPTWTLPAGMLSWGKTSFWYVALYDGKNMTYLEGPYAITPVVAQPEITNHLAGAADDADAAGLNPQVGNYSTAATDASVPVAGPPLEIRRTYNSQDPRSTGAFGAGWSTPLDQRVTTDPDGSGNVVVTLASGRQVRFGRNADGSYAPPPGMNATLVHGTGTWTLRDPSGEQRTFDDVGNLTTVADAYARKQQYTYTGGVISQVKDVPSGRSLYLTWQGGRVATVKTDAPVAGGTQPVWTYTYDAGRLTRVCSPLSATACVTYEYQTTSHYRSIVTDANPLSYLPFPEKSGSTAGNVVARKPGENNGSYSNAVLGQGGALAGTPDPSVSFDSARSSAVVMPDNLLTSTMGFAVELWFKAAPGKGGVLYGEQNAALGTNPSHWSPGLYVRTDGKLHGSFWSPAGGEIVTGGRVDDGNWHHVVLSVYIDRQDLYLDGQPAGSLTGRIINHLDMSRSAVGNGFTQGWSGGANGYYPFTGQIDDFAVYRHPLGALQVSGHWAARTATSRLTKIIEPGNFTAMQATYDSGSGRLTTMRDRNGAQWTLSTPVVGDGTRAVTLSASDRDAITYTFDAMHGGRVVSRRTTTGTEKWEYDANGFASKYTDANGRERFMYRDDRGNITWESVFRAGAWDWKNYGYYLNPNDRLDPRNDHVVWRSGTRNAWDNDPRNRIWYDLDAAGRTTKVTYPTQAGADAYPTETATFSAGTEAAVGGGTVPAGLVIRATNRMNGATTYAYNSRGDLMRTVDPVGLTTDYGYDQLGRDSTRTTSAVVGGQTVPYGTWTTTYNAIGLRATETEPAVANPVTGVTHTALSTYTYDDGGRVKEKAVSDTTGGDATRRWTYTYDPAGRPETTTTPDGGVTTQTWNTAGDLARQVDPTGLTTEYRYDDSRRLIETAAVGAGVDPADPAATRLVLESRSYDPAGQLASVVDALGRETAFTYHNDGLLESKKLVRRDAQGTVTSSTLLGQYEYDYGGNLIRSTGPAGVVHDYDYDDMGYRNRETLDAGGIARTSVYTFTPDGSPTSRKDSNGYTFLTGRTAEAPYLFTAGGSQIDGAGNRYADGTATFTYRFVLPADTSTATLNLEVDNQFVISFSSDNQNWTEVARETGNVQDGSNRMQRFFSLDSYLRTSKTVYVKVGDSRPADGWGGAVSRVALDYTRTGEQPLRTTNRYDAAGRQIATSVDNPGGTPAALTTTTNRDARGLVTQTIDPLGAETDQAYDAVGNLVSTTGQPLTVWRAGTRTDNVIPVNTAGRNTFGDVTQVRDANGAVTRTGVDGMGRPTSVTLPAYTPPGEAALNPVTTTRYAPDGQPLEVTDPLGRKTTYEYDGYGRQTAKTGPDPDGSGPKAAPVWRQRYDRAGEKLETTDPTGARVSATYNDLGYPVTNTVAERIGADTVYYTTTLTPDDAGRLSSEKSPLGHVTTYGYDAAGERTRTTDPAGVVTERRYDPLGRPTTDIIAGARATSYGYDGAGRQVRQSSHTVANGQLSAPLRTRQTGYDALGRPTKVTSAAGRITTYGYDPGGRLSTVTQLENPTDPTSAISVQLGYDAVGHRTHTVDGRGDATDVLYNDWGLPTATKEPATTDPPDRTWTTVYDAAGQAVREVVPDGVVRTRTFDGLGRVTTETGTGTGSPTSDRGLDYDADGRITRASGPGGDTMYTWNDRGLLTGSTGPGGTASFGYDAEGNLTSRTDAAGSATFTYDDARRLKTVTDPLTGRTATYGYAPTGELASIGSGTGAPARAYTLDNLGRLATDTLVKADGSPAASTTYGYDLDDLVTSRVTTGLAGAGGNGYGYDGLGRLTTWTRPDNQQVGYGYDAASNRTTITGPAGTRTFTFDPRNRLTSATGGGQPDLTNTWSGRGTLETTTVGTDTTRYHNDAFDRPVTVDEPTTTITYGYDALDRVAQRNGDQVSYADQTNDAVRAPLADGTAVIFRGPDGTPLSDRTGSDPARLLTADRLHGDLVAATAPDTGAVTASAGYAPYGEVTASAGRLALGFQGGWTDPATGLVDAHARWYSPDQATFTSRDSMTLDPDPVAQANRYAYANASPVTFADANGHCLEDACVGEGILVVGAIVALIGYFTVKAVVQSDPVADAFNQLYDMSNSALHAFMTQLYVAGVRAIDIIHQVAVRFAGDSSVTQITNRFPAPKTPTVKTPTTPAAPPRPVPAPPAFKPLPPVEQTITNLRPPELSLTPAGTQLQNAVAATTAATIPSVMLANADGSDQQNAAAGAAIVAAGATVLAGTGDPSNCDDDPRKIIEDIAQEVVDEGLPGIDADLTRKQWDAVKAEPWRLWQYRGSEVHKRAADLLEERYGDRFAYRTRGVDFIDNLTGKLIELTTPGQVGSHKKKGGDYESCDYATYKWKK